MKKLILLIAIIILSCSKDDDNAPQEEQNYRVTIVPSNCSAHNMNQWIHYCITKQTHDQLYAQYGNPTSWCNFIEFTTKDGQQREGYYVSVGNDFTGVCD